MATFAQAQGFIGAAGSSMSITIPTPTAGNMMVLWVAQAAVGTLTITSPSGWTTMENVNAGSGSTTRSFRGFYKIAGAGETTSVSLSSTASNVWCAGYGEWSGVGPNTVLDNTQEEDAQTNASGTVNTPSMTPSPGGYAALVTFACYDRASATFSAPAVSGSNVGAITERVDTVQNDGGGAGQSIIVAEGNISNVSGAYQGSATASTAGVGAGGIAIFKNAVLAMPAEPNLPLIYLRKNR